MGINLFSPSLQTHISFPIALSRQNFIFLGFIFFFLLCFSQQAKYLSVLTLILAHFVLLTVYAHQTFGQYT